MLENLPFFLQPGTKALNKGSLEFGNNSRIITAATTGSSIRGLSINLLYLDEFAVDVIITLVSLPADTTGYVEV